MYVPGVDAPRSIPPVDAFIFSPAGDAENVPPVAPVVVSVVVPVAQKVPPLTVAVGAVAAVILAGDDGDIHVLSVVLLTVILCEPTATPLNVADAW